MVSTTYRGDATIDGESVRAELLLEDGRLRLYTDTLEVGTWSLSDCEVVPRRSGGYTIRTQEGSFAFSPVIDGGLDDEVELRVGSPAASRDLPTVTVPGVPAPSRRRSRPRFKRPPSARVRYRSSRTDLDARAAIVILAVAALVVLGVALVVGALEQRSSTLTPAPQPSDGQATSPATVPSSAEPAPPLAPGTSPPGPEPRPIPPPGPPPTTPPPTAPTTATPLDPGTARSSLFESDPATMVARWNDLAARVEAPVEIAGSSASGAFRLVAGARLVLDGSTDDTGNVASLAVLGDPSGTTQEDLVVLTGLGMAVSLADPELPPEGRRAVIETLGLDIENPDLTGLDASTEFRGVSYSLRWDADLERIVLVLSLAEGA